MEPVNIQKLKVNDTIQYFDVEQQGWYIAQVVLVGLNFLYIRGLTGSLTDLRWTEDYGKLADPDFYLAYQEIPTPPKKRKRITSSVIAITICIILTVINVIITIFFR